MNDQKSFKVFLQENNWQEFEEYFLDFAIAFGEAGSSLRLNAEPILIEPDFDELEDPNDPLSDRKYPDKETYGRTMWLDDRREFHKRVTQYNAHKEALLAKLLSPDILSSGVMDKLKSDPTYDVLIINKDILRIFQILKRQGVSRGAGVHSLSSASIAFFNLFMNNPFTGEKLTFERYIILFKSNLRNINLLSTYPMEDEIVTSRFLLGLDASIAKEANKSNLFEIRKKVDFQDFFYKLKNRRSFLGCIYLFY